MYIERIPGSARGARVGGCLFAAAFSAPMLTYDWSLPGTKSALWLLLVTVFWLVRPWFMGVWLTSESVIVRGWFRTSVMLLAEIEGVSIVRYAGMFSWGSIGWLPLAGAVAVVKIRVKGEARDFPGTIGRQVTVRAVARRIREAAGIALTRLDFDPLQ